MQGSVLGYRLKESKSNQEEPSRADGWRSVMGSAKGRRPTIHSWVLRWHRVSLDAELVAKLTYVATVINGVHLEPSSPEEGCWASTSTERGRGHVGPAVGIGLKLDKGSRRLIYCESYGIINYLVGRIEGVGAY